MGQGKSSGGISSGGPRGRIGGGGGISPNPQYAPSWAAPPGSRSGASPTMGSGGVRGGAVQSKASIRPQGQVGTVQKTPSGGVTGGPMRQPGIPSGGMGIASGPPPILNPMTPNMPGNTMSGIGGMMGSGGYGGGISPDIQRIIDMLQQGGTGMFGSPY